MSGKGIGMHLGPSSIITTVMITAERLPLFHERLLRYPRRRRRKRYPTLVPNLITIWTGQTVSQFLAVRLLRVPGQFAGRLRLNLNGLILDKGPASLVPIHPYLQVLLP